jgi:hypothetical protein
MLAPVIHVLPLATIQRERLLPVPGRVIVRKGQKVNSVDVIAEANLAPEHIVLDLARGLGLSPEKADQHLQRRAGDQVSEGDVVAGPVGLARRVVRAPRPGKVILAGNGQILLEAESAPFELRAGLPGLVSTLIPERGAVIESTGALIQGVWGNGKIDSGLMHVLLSKPEDELTTDHLDVSLRGSVILAGYCGEAKVLHTAAELPLRGLILASMAASLAPIATTIDFPIVVIEGFGLLPLNTPAFNLLSTSDRREIALNAEPYDIFAGTRPEVVIPLPVAGNPAEPKEAAFFTPDQRVRVVRAPYQAQTGNLIALRPGLQVFPSGLRAPGAEIQLDNGEEVVLPLANLEILA